MSTERSKSDTNNSSEIDWTPENEIKLFYAMRGHKPVGIGKNFHMIAILEQFIKATEREMSSKTLWSRLDKLYDMETLDENEDIPFPNHYMPFTIEGNKEFEELIAKRFPNDSNKSEKDIDFKEDIEITANPLKAGNKSKIQESVKTNTKGKAETEKSSKSDRKEESVKQMDKNDEMRDNRESNETVVSDISVSSKRSKKPLPKSSTELRSASHNSPSSAKKRK